MVRILDDGSEEAKTWEVSPKLFESAAACTTHRYQGKTIHTNEYNIHQLSSMNLNDAYTALSRATHVNAPRFMYTNKKFKRPRATTATWLTPLAEVYVGGLYKITSPGGDKIYYGQVLDYNRAGKRFKEHCANSDEEIQNDWHLEMVARHCVTGRPALERFEKALIQSHDDPDVKCINITYNATRGDAMKDIELRVDAARKDTRRATNLLQESVQVIEYSKKKKGRTTP